MKNLITVLILTIEFWWSNISDFECEVIEVVPEEDGPLLWIIQEFIEQIEVLVLPVFFLLEIFQGLTDELDHLLHSYN